MIDWTKATDIELGELYDALYERNDRLSKTLETIHIRMVTERYQAFRAFQNSLLSVSHTLADAVFAEFKRRYPPSETNC